MRDVLKRKLRLPFKSERVADRGRFINEKIAFAIRCYQFHASITIKIVNSEALGEYIRASGFVNQYSPLNIGVCRTVIFKNKESIVVVIRTNNFLLSITIHISDRTTGEKWGFPDNLLRVPTRDKTLNEKGSRIVGSQYFEQTVVIGVIYRPRNELFEIRESLHTFKGMCQFISSAWETFIDREDSSLQLGIESFRGQRTPDDFKLTVSVEVCGDARDVEWWNIEKFFSESAWRYIASNNVSGIKRSAVILSRLQVCRILCFNKKLVSSARQT